MRQELFRIWLERPWSVTEVGPTGILTIGAGWIWLALAIAFFLYHGLRRDKAVLRDPMTGILWGGSLLAVSFVHQWFPRLPATLPLFGYGVMTLLGFLGAMAFCRARAKAVGLNPDLIYDMAFWLLVGGVVGGRIGYLVQYWDEIVRPGMNLGEAAFAIINLSGGGLVLIGALVGGALGFTGFCLTRKLPFLDLADLVVPGVFVGIGFGRLGCLLNGCCFGDRCELPWAIVFPRNSVPFLALVERGFLAPDALATFPLHPTQIYSSLDGFLLAFVTATYFWYRRYPGDVFALGCILYACTRFLIEFLRADEMGQLGTIFTISQFYSLAIFALGLAVMAGGPWRARRRPSIPDRRVAT